MQDFFSRNKVFLISIIGTIVLLIGGVFLLTKDNDSSPSSTNPISSEILVPEGSQKTSGIVNDEYQPATSSANITLVEFGDYQCPACSVYSPFVKQLLTEMAGKINFVFRNFPLSQHANAEVSAYAAEAAGLQGKFWEMHTKLYETQTVWSGASDPKSIFIGYARELGINIDQFKKDMDSSIVKEIVEKGKTDGNLIRLDSTPTLYVNGIKMGLVGSYEEFKNSVISAK